MGRIGPMLIGALLAVTLVLCGCKPAQQQQPKQPEQEKKTQADVPTPDVPPVTPTVNVQPPVNPIDQKDSADPRVQGLFPKSNVVGQWTKVREVRLYEAANLGALDNGAAYPAYGVDWAAEMMYQLGERRNQQAVVQLFHSGSAKDAYGLMTSISSSPLGSQFGPGTEARGEQGRLLVVNKGKFLLSVYSLEDPGSAAFANALGDLAQWIVDRLEPATGVSRPDLVAVLPTGGTGEPTVRYFRGGLWLARHDAAFASDKIARVEADDEVVLADYTCRRSDALPPLRVQIFVVRYSSPGKAKEAYDRLCLVQTNPTDPDKVPAGFPGSQLLVGGIKGQCVYGTLTGDEYGVMEDWVNREHADDAQKYPVMPTLESVLP